MRRTDASILGLITKPYSTLEFRALRVCERGMPVLHDTCRLRKLLGPDWMAKTVECIYLATVVPDTSPQLENGGSTLATSHMFSLMAPLIVCTEAFQTIGTKVR